MPERLAFYRNIDSGIKYPIGDLFGYADSLITARTSGRGHGLVVIRERLGSSRIVSVDKHAPYLEAQRLALASGETTAPYEFLSLSGSPLPFADEAFGAIFFMHVIEHIEDPERLLREMHRVLRRDGKLVIATPNLKNLVAPNPTDEHVYREGELPPLLSEVGFESAEHHLVPNEAAWKVHSRKRLLAHLPGARTLRDRIPRAISDRAILRRGITPKPLTLHDFDLSTSPHDRAIDILILARKIPQLISQ